MDQDIYVPSYIPLSDGQYQPYWVLVKNVDYFNKNNKPMKRYVFRFPFRPDSWNFYSVTQNATSKYEAIKHIITSLNEMAYYYKNPEHKYFSTINGLGPDTIDYECIVKHYNFIVEQLHQCKPDVFNIHATEWCSALA